MIILAEAISEEVMRLQPAVPDLHVPDASSPQRCRILARPFVSVRRPSDAKSNDYMQSNPVDLHALPVSVLLSLFMPFQRNRPLSFGTCDFS